MADYPVADSPVFIQWQPPPFAALNATFQNPANQDTLCPVASIWYAGWVNSIQDDSNADETAVDYGLAVSAASTATYMITLLNMTNPSYLPDTNSNFTAGETMLAWYTESPSFPYFLVDVIPATACNDAICQNLDWQGDQDVSGVGMIISYYMVAIMVTLYFFFNVAAIFRDHRSEVRATHRPRNVLFHTIMVAFRSSVHIFQDAALIFAISMSIAGITRYVTTLNNPTKHYQIYGLIGSVFMSTFTIFPAVILQTVIEVKRHFWLRLFLWFLLIPAAITLDVLYEVLYKNRNWDPTYLYLETDDVPRKQAVELVWLEYCDFPDQRNRLRTVLTIGHVLLAGNVLWWLYHVLRASLPKMNSARIKRWWGPIQQFAIRHKVERRFLLLNALACLTFMWLFVALFHKYRNSVKEKAGDSNTDTTWTFGQVMAVTTWIPVFVDWVTAAIYESKHESEVEAREKKHPHQKGGYQPADGAAAPDPEVDSLYMGDPGMQKQPFHVQSTQYPPQTAHGQQYHQGGHGYQMQQFHHGQQYHGQQAPEVYYDPS